TLEPDDMIAGQIDNTATADSDQTDPVDDSTDAPIDQTPAIKIDKLGTLSDDADGSGDISVGDTITYTYTATNTGNITLDNLTITDDVLGAIDLGVEDDVNADGVTILQPGATEIATATVVVAQADVNTGSIENLGTVSADDPNDDPVTDEDPETIPIPQSELIVVKTNTGFNDNDSSNDISVGDDILYEITATNTGDANLTNVIITDDLTGDTSASVTLVPGASETLSVSYTVQESDLGTTIANTGIADSDQTDPVTDPEEVDVPDPELSVVKTNTGFTDNDGNGFISVGDDVLYDITATNTGDANLTNVVISDDLTGDASTPVDLAPGESNTLSVSYTVQDSDVGTTIANVGVADSDQTDPVTEPEEV
ncbi:conserved repeat protein, partial [Xenococcus sp. PCC 7305]